MVSTDFFLILIVLLVLELIYLYAAKKFKIIDKPNDRSSHITPTIRGGGIVVLLGFIVFTFWNTTLELDYLYLLTGVILVGTISFIDDIITLSSKVRIVFHLAAFGLMFYGLNLFNLYPVFAIVFIFVFSIGFLNIYNFMDGINGLTFLYSLITFVTFLIINEYVKPFTNSNLLVVLILALVVFGFFNFRNKPKCFAGDIGSITIGLSVIYFVIGLYIKSQNPLIFFFISVYLVDGGWTILERLYRKENIFKAHKRHLYQILANELKFNHLKISLVYFIFQMAISSIALQLIVLEYKSPLILLIGFIIMSGLYIIVKRNFLQKI